MNAFNESPFAAVLKLSKWAPALRRRGPTAACSSADHTGELISHQSDTKVAGRFTDNWVVQKRHNSQNSHRGGHNPLKGMSAKDAKDGFGRLIDTARAEPVVIEKHGRAVVVVMSVEEFERLRALNSEKGRS
jgi:prevent-host-death family protein